VSAFRVGRGIGGGPPELADDSSGGGDTYAGPANENVCGIAACGTAGQGVSGTQPRLSCVDGAVGLDAVSEFTAGGGNPNAGSAGGIASDGNPKEGVSGTVHVSPALPEETTKQMPNRVC
jgi:hypothetical protein